MCSSDLEAATAGVRVCLWAHDPRKIFAEIGRAIGRAELSKLLIAHKLLVAGHQPLPDPGPRPERTRKLIKAMLPKPLKSLSLDSEGNLIVPTEAELSKACPVALTPEQLIHFDRWRVEFTRPGAAVPPTASPTFATALALAPTPPALNGGSSCAEEIGRAHV